jgi:hypothetical protein
VARTAHATRAIRDPGWTAREEGTRKFLSLRRDELDRHFPGLIELALRGENAR